MQVQPQLPSISWQCYWHTSEVIGHVISTVGRTPVFGRRADPILCSTFR